MFIVVSDGKLENGRPKNTNPPVPKTKNNGAAPVYIRSEVRRERGRDSAVNELEKFRTEVATRLREHYER
jgi:hypothetical protein